jgi:hypothetical protein
MYKWFAFILLFIGLSHFGFSQDRFVVQNRKQSDKIRFKLINNLIVIPVDINGVTLSFLLDTGVSKPIIFNFLNVSDTLQIKHTETIFLRGLGGGESVEALKSTNNIFKIGDAVKINQELYAVFNNDLNFAPRLGIPVHGIIGLDLFKDLVVEINYSAGYVKLTEPHRYRYKPCKKCERFNLEFYNGKPYLNASVEIENKTIPVKLLIDSGGSDALWLFENDSLEIKPNEKFFNDFLGHGLNGSVYGKRSKIQTLFLKSFVLKDANVAFPNAENVLFATRIKNRNGSISGNILKRFNIVFDYQKALMVLSRNSHFKEKFSYNKSGIELAHDGVRIVKQVKDAVKVGDNSQSRNNNIILDPHYELSLQPAYAIVELREGSPAEQAGLKIGDIVLAIDGMQTHQYTLQQIIHKFYDYHGKKIKMKIDRNGTVLNYNFQLQRPF